MIPISNQGIRDTGLGVWDWLLDYKRNDGKCNNATLERSINYGAIKLERWNMTTQKFSFLTNFLRRNELFQRFLRQLPGSGNEMRADPAP